jgi:TatA/E family protein of Tat protein translocase
MFGSSLGFPELVFILVLALLIFGPKRLPEIGRTLGKGLSEFRRATNDLKRTIESEVALEDDRETPRRPAALPNVMRAPEPSNPAPSSPTSPDPTPPSSTPPGSTPLPPPTSPA